MAGIYSIQNINDNRRYIGSAESPLGRMAEHKIDLRNGKPVVIVMDIIT